MEKKENEMNRIKNGKNKVVFSSKEFMEVRLPKITKEFY